MKNSNIKILFSLALISVSLSFVQAQVSYTVDEANATKWQNFAHFELSTHLLGTTGMGLSVGAQSQYKLPILPVTLAGRFRYEVGGLADVLYAGEIYGPSRNIELAAMIPILPSRSKPGKVKVTTSFDVSTTTTSTTTSTTTYEEYFHAKGEKKNELMARGGFFQYWTKGNFTSTGLSGGLTLRMRKHVDVSLASEEGYHREVFTNKQLYFDVLYAPVLNGIRDDEGYNLGARLGFLRAASSGMNYYTELELRPGLIASLTFGWLFGRERL